MVFDVLLFFFQTGWLFFDRLIKQSCAKISVPVAGKSGIVSGGMRHYEVAGERQG
jgi:hypothetical protein